MWRTAGVQVHADQGVGVRKWKRLHLLIQLLHELCPVFQTNLEDLPVLNLRNANEVEMAVSKEVSIGQILNQLDNVLVKLENHGLINTHVEMHGEEVAKEKGQVLNKLLISRIARVVGSLQIHRKRNDFRDRS